MLNQIPLTKPLHYLKPKVTESAWREDDFAHVKPEGVPASKEKNKTIQG